MKRKALLSSIVTIALCLSLIAGSTFALFTDKTEFNIAITSGDVEIKAAAQIAGLWSAEGPVAAHNDKYLKDENGNYYDHVAQNDTFFNGGTAEVVNGELQISKLTPGDKVDVEIVTDNLSDVAFRYRYVIEVKEDGGLATGMVLTTHSDEVYEAVKSYTSEWFDIVRPGEVVPVQKISLELPVYAGNEYQSEHEGGYDDNGVQYTDDILKSVTYTVRVEAVQGNAVTTEKETFVTLYPVQSALELAIENGGEVNTEGAPVVTNGALWLSANPVTFKNTVVDATNYDYNPQTDEGDAFAIAGYNVNTNLTLTDGAKILAPVSGEQRNGIFYYDGEHVLTISANSKIVAEGENNTCITTYYNDLTLYLEDAASLVATDNAKAIMVGATATLTIIVPDDTVEAAVNEMINNGLIVTDGTAVTVQIAE